MGGLEREVVTRPSHVNRKSTKLLASVSFDQSELRELIRLATLWFID